MFQSLAGKFAAFAARFPFDTLVWIIWGSFAALFVAALSLCIALPAVREAGKRPFLCLVYAYTALTFALFLTVNAVQEALFVACVFWLAGYILYGVLCFASRPRKKRAPAQVAASVSAPLPAPPHTPPAVKSAPPAAAAKNNIRLEHAIAVTGSLLAKNLGRTDRLEVEKLKNTLEVMRVKGALTPAEGEILNENFNTLLKLMAKYNI